MASRRARTVTCLRCSLTHLIGPVTEPEKAPALWVDLEYPDGRKQTVKGFAIAWTPDAVYAQWVEFSRAREAWVRPDQCRRREIPVKHRFGT